jgi:flagellar biosynthetic protein FliP
LQRADTQFEVGTTPAHESGITDGATSSGMPSASRILTRALPAGLLAVLAAPAAALAAPATSAATGLPDVSLKVGGTTNNPGTTLTILGLLTLLTVAPSILVMMTGFTRILIVLSFVRNALGTQQMPPNQVLVGFALFLSLFVMAPTLRQIDHQALQPYLAHKLEAKPALLKAEIPIKRFMLKQTRASDLALFLKLAHQAPPKSRDQISITTLVPAFMISELKTAFEIGFLVYVPFLIIDLVISSTLMSMGMMMLPPVLISLPFKILLFVLVDGWALLTQSLVAGFHT